VCGGIQLAPLFLVKLTLLFLVSFFFDSHTSNIYNIGTASSVPQIPGWSPSVLCFHLPKTQFAFLDPPNQPLSHDSLSFSTPRS